MIVLFAGFVFSPELPELLNNLVISANLLVDDKQHGIKREHHSQHNPYHFGFHNGPLHRHERTTKERRILRESPPLRVLSFRVRLCKGRDAVRPGLDRGTDGLIRVGREADPVTAEVHHEQFTVGIMTPEGCRESIILCIMESGTGMCGADSRSGKQRGHPGIKPGEGVEPV
jgi:hypothetical protein